jgi:hypothetical protein
MPRDLRLPQMTRVISMSARDGVGSPLASATDTPHKIEVSAMACAASISAETI